ncbi:MAG: gamma-glutamylcyclotransferase [Hyphomicrobiales bacterium]
MARCPPLSLTQELVARVHRVEPDPGPDPRFTQMTDEDFAEEARRILAAGEGAPLWVFAYGSLIWRPEFDHVEHRPVRLHGWRRSFCLRMERWRGSPGEPGLMMALERGGSCHGIAYRLPAGDDFGWMQRLLKRESDYKGDCAWTRWLTVADGEQRFRALTFWAEPRTEGMYEPLPIEEQARRIARAAGHLGSGAEYLHNTVTKLAEHGIHDRYLWRLQHLVAEEIARIG